MKTNVLMKIAVVFMAAFGAYAFSGNTNQQYPLKEYRLNEQDECTDLVEARCSENGNYDCMVVKNNQSLTLFDTGCHIITKHINPSPVEWK